jgi:excisionase family DNA binding protein
MELMTIAEVAEASRMSPSWWRQKIFRREINFLKLGRSVRIPKSTLDEILEKSKVQKRESRN